MFRKIGATVGCLALVSACGILETKEKAKKLSQNDAALSGGWESSCTPTDKFELAHTKKIYNFSALGDFDKEEDFYTNEKCEQPGFTYQVTGTYAALGESQENKDLKKINFTVEKALVKVKSEDAVTALNTIKLCDKTDWKVGEEVNVADKDCAKLAHKKGDVIFDVYKIQDKKLLFGQSFLLLSGDDPDDRPTEVKEELAYSKK